MDAYDRAQLLDRGEVEDAIKCVTQTMAEYSTDFSVQSWGVAVFPVCFADSRGGEFPEVCHNFAMYLFYLSIISGLGYFLSEHGFDSSVWRFGTGSCCIGTSLYRQQGSGVCTPRIVCVVFCLFIVEKSSCVVGGATKAKFSIHFVTYDRIYGRRSDSNCA